MLYSLKLVPNPARPYDHVPTVGKYQELQEHVGKPCPKCLGRTRVQKAPFGGYTWTVICADLACGFMLVRLKNDPRGATQNGSDNNTTDARPKVELVKNDAPPVAVTPPAKLASVPQDKAALLAELLSGLSGKPDPEELQRMVNAKVREEMAKQFPPLVIKLEGREVPTYEGLAHEAVPEVLKLVARGFRNIYLWGPPGTGKTTIADCIAKALDRIMADVSMSAGVTEFHWTGRTVPNITDGTSRFVPSNFTSTVDKASVYLVDEVDHGDANAVAKLNMFLANDRILLADGRTLTRHPDNILLCGSNTSGRGGDRANTAASALTASFLDRFTGAVVRVDYDRKLELALAKGITPKAQEVCAAVWELREKVIERSLRGRFVGTRAIIATAKHVAGGDTPRQATERLLADWSKEERSSIGRS